MIVVSDTTALTTLMKAGLDSVLKRLFGKVAIPEMVAIELRQFHTNIPVWCEVHHIHQHPLLLSFHRTLMQVRPRPSALRCN